MTRSHIHGRFTDLHSAYGGEARQIVKLTVSTTEVETSFGEQRICTVGTLCEITFALEDLMLALRDGGPGHKTPCTIGSLFGLTPAREPPEPTEQVRILETIDIAANQAAFGTLAERLAALAEATGLATRADRMAAAAIFDEAAALYAAQRGQAVDAVTAKADQVDAGIREDMRARMEAPPQISDDARGLIGRRLAAPKTG